eukprot:gene19489-50894_t
MLEGGTHAGQMVHVRPGKEFKREMAEGTEFGKKLTAGARARRDGDRKRMPPPE